MHLLRSKLTHDQKVCLMWWVGTGCMHVLGGQCERQVWKVETQHPGRKAPKPFRMDFIQQEPPAMLACFPRRVLPSSGASYCIRFIHSLSNSPFCPLWAGPELGAGTPGFLREGAETFRANHTPMKCHVLIQTDHSRRSKSPRCNSVISGGWHSRCFSILGLCVPHSL